MRRITSAPNITRRSAKLAPSWPRWLPQPNSHLYSARRHPKGHRAAQDYAFTSTAFLLISNSMKPTTFWTVNSRSAVPAGISTGNSSSIHMRHSAHRAVHSKILLKTRTGSHLGKRQAHLFGDHSYNSVLNAHTTIAWFFAILSPELMRILFNKRYNKSNWP